MARTSPPGADAPKCRWRSSRPHSVPSRMSWPPRREVGRRGGERSSGRRRPARRNSSHDGSDTTRARTRRHPDPPGRRRHPRRDALRSRAHEDDVGRTVQLFDEYVAAPPHPDAGVGRPFEDGNALARQQQSRGTTGVDGDAPGVCRLVGVGRLITRSPAWPAWRRSARRLMGGASSPSPTES